MALRRSRVAARIDTVRIVFAGGDYAEPHIAFAIGKKVGGAVVRNRVRRRLRAIAADLESAFQPGVYLINVLPGGADVSYRELKDKVQQAIAQLHEPPKR